VKRLYYLGRKIKNIADVRVWFGAKKYVIPTFLIKKSHAKFVFLSLRIRELLAALGQNIGLEPTVLCELDLEQLISVIDLFNYLSIISIGIGLLNKLRARYK
jgi:hypothetical protein